MGDKALALALGCCAPSGLVLYIPYVPYLGMVYVICVTTESNYFGLCYSNDDVTSLYSNGDVTSLYSNGDVTSLYSNGDVTSLYSNLLWQMRQNF